MPRFRQYAKDASGVTVPTNYSSPYAFCSEVVLKLGRAASYAIVHIPLKGTDETGPAVAGVRGGPLEGIKIGTQAAVYDVFSGNENLVISGYVADIRQDLKDDAASIVIVDHRYILAGLKMVGQYSISGISGVAYRQGLRCLMNEDGLPNATAYDDGSGVMIPIFCPANYGLEVGAAPKTSLQVGYASYWTPSMALEYIRWVQTSAAAAALRTNAATITDPVVYPFAFMPAAPSSIVWPQTYHEIVNGQDQFLANGLRKTREIDLEGQSVLDAISECAEMGGKYALNIEPTADFKGTIAIVPTRYSGGGLSVARGVAGNANPVLDNCIFAAGSIEENGMDLFTIVAVAGESVYVEKRFDTISGSLVWSHSATDLFNWKTHIGTATTTAARLHSFEEANTKYPNVCSTLRVATNHNYLTGTEEEGLPLANSSKAPLPNLLSSSLEGTTGAAQTDLLSNSFAIRFEYSYDNGANWFCAEAQDGLTLNYQTGLISIDGLRSIGRTFFGTSTSEGVGLDDKLEQWADLTAAAIRVTLAVPADHRLTAARKLATDDTQNIALSADPQDDCERIEKGFSRLMYVDAARLYAKYIRKDAYPIPAKAGGTAYNDIIRNDSNYIAAHAQSKISDFGRINKTARLVYPLLYSLWRPGYSIKELWNVGADESLTSTVPIRAVCHEVTFKCGKMQNTTELRLG